MDRDNLALDLAPKINGGVVWINGANCFDVTAGFGGHRESGFGREGGVEGLCAYLKPIRKSALLVPTKAFACNEQHYSVSHACVDRTAKNYSGGKQKRPVI